MDWNQRYIDKDTPWDHGEPAPPLVEFLKSHEFKGDILVPGCGKGNDVRLLADQGAQVTGIDISPVAVKEAKAITVVANETYEVQDLFNLPEKYQQKFDGIFEHTCFCTISPELRADYVRIMHSVLKENAYLLGIFFTYVDDEVPGEAPMSTSPEELDVLFDPYFKLLKRQCPSEVFSNRTDCTEEIRLMQVIRNPLPAINSTKFRQR